MKYCLIASTIQIKTQANKNTLCALRWGGKGTCRSKVSPDTKMCFSTTGVLLLSTHSLNIQTRPDTSRHVQTRPDTSTHNTAIYVIFPPNILIRWGIWDYLQQSQLYTGLWIGSISVFLIPHDHGSLCWNLNFQGKTVTVAMLSVQFLSSLLSIVTAVSSEPSLSSP